MMLLAVWLGAWILAAVLIGIKIQSKLASVGGGFIVSIIAVLIVAQITGIEKAPRPDKPHRLSDTECLQSLQCWGDRHINAVGFKCKEAIEQRAKHGHRWTDSAIETKFDSFKWLNQQNGTITFIGNKLELQNGLGAWIKHRYECDYNPLTKTVIAVRANRQP